MRLVSPRFNLESGSRKRTLLDPGGLLHLHSNIVDFPTDIHNIRLHSSVEVESRKIEQKTEHLDAPTSNQNFGGARRVRGNEKR